MRVVAIHSEPYRLGKSRISLIIPKSSLAKHRCRISQAMLTVSSEDISTMIYLLYHMYIMVEIYIMIYTYIYNAILGKHKVIWFSKTFSNIFNVVYSTSKITQRSNALVLPTMIMPVVSLKNSIAVRTLLEAFTASLWQCVCSRAWHRHPRYRLWDKALSSHLLPFFSSLDFLIKISLYSPQPLVVASDSWLINHYPGCNNATHHSYTSIAHSSS